MGLWSENVRFYRLWFGDLGANGVMTSVGRTGRKLSRSAPQTQTALGRRLVLASDSQRTGWSTGVANYIGTSVGQIRERKQRWDVGNIVGRSASGSESIGVGVLVGLTELVERRR